MGDKYAIGVMVILQQRGKVEVIGFLLILMLYYKAM